MVYPSEENTSNVHSSTAHLSPSAHPEVAATTNVHHIGAEDNDEVHISVRHDASDQIAEFTIGVDEALGSMMQAYTSMVTSTDPSVSHVVFRIEGRKLESHHTPYDWDLRSGEHIDAQHITLQEVDQRARLIQVKDTWSAVAGRLQEKYPVSQPSKHPYSVSVQKDGISVRCAVPGCKKWIRVGGSWCKNTYVPNLRNWRKHWATHDLEHMLAKVTCTLNVILCTMYPV